MRIRVVLSFALALGACGDFEMQSEWSEAGLEPFEGLEPRTIEGKDPPDPGPTPGSTKALVVNEVFFRVDGLAGDASRDGAGLANDRFLEIANVSTEPVSLEGVEIWEAHEPTARLRIDFNLSLGPGRAILVFGGSASISGGSVTCGAGLVVTNQDLRLDPTDSVRLVRGTEVLDEVAWTDSPANVSLTRIPDGTGPLVEHPPITDRTSIAHQWSPGCRSDGITEF